MRAIKGVCPTKGRDRFRYYDEKDRFNCYDELAKSSDWNFSFGS